ncbi:ABC transporter permease, partial [Lancefieldella parvula]|uniref:ABC transporter permease n=1 Tax=Lancefieldella parvula TaxID=1382 RepID=UPI0028D32FF4
MARFVWYVTKRILSYIVMIFVATSLTFFLASSFMNPRSNFEQRTPRPPQESIEENLYRTNLNDKTPVIERYQVWITNLLTKFDFGMTPTGDNVNREMSSKFMASIELMTPATILSVVIGVSLGVYTAQRQYQWQDRFLSGVASILLVIPTVVMAILIVFAAIEINARAGTRIFYVTDLSSGDTGNFFTWLIDFLQHIILPTIVLTIVSSVGYHLSQRTYLLDEMHADYVRTARAKGLTRKKAI